MNNALVIERDGGGLEKRRRSWVVIVVVVVVVMPCRRGEHGAVTTAHAFRVHMRLAGVRSVRWHQRQHTRVDGGRSRGGTAGEFSARERAGERAVCLGKNMWH